MSLVRGEMPVTTYRTITTGLRCDKCQKVHPYAPPPGGTDHAYLLSPHAKDWIRLRSPDLTAEGYPETCWDLCPECAPLARQFLGEGFGR